MTTLQEQARALGDPTRHGIFQYLVTADDQVDVAELTEHFGLNHNAVRQHLAKLVSAGLVTESTAAPSGRGRPRLLYRTDPTADPRWGPTGPYERLAVLLTEVVRTGDTPVEVGRRAGRLMARGASRTSIGISSTSISSTSTPSTSASGGATGEGVAAGPDPVETVVDRIARLGFDPTVRRRGNRVAITLRACPFASAVLADQTVVCDLHLGMAEGLAEAVGGITVDELVVKDPLRANCTICCEVVDA